MGEARSLEALVEYSELSERAAREARALREIHRARGEEVHAGALDRVVKRLEAGAAEARDGNLDHSPRRSPLNLTGPLEMAWGAEAQPMFDAIEQVMAYWQERLWVEH